MRAATDKRREKGAAAVELAILLPVLVTLLVGTLELGRAYNASITVTHAAREAVRRVAIKDSGNAITAGQTAAAPLSVTVSTRPCTAAIDAKATVTHVFSYDIPFFTENSLTITKSAVMKCGG